MNKYSIVIQYSPDDNAFVASVPELPGCMADGETAVQAVEAIHETIRMWIETAERRGYHIPKPNVKWRDEL